MSRAERPALRRGSPKCPDPQWDGGGSPLSPLYRSSFEDECRTIAARLLTGSSPGLVTSTPLKSSSPPAAGSPSGSALVAPAGLRGASFCPVPRDASARSPAGSGSSSLPAPRAALLEGRPWPGGHPWGLAEGLAEGLARGPVPPLPSCPCPQVSRALRAVPALPSGCSTASLLPPPAGAKLKTTPAAKSRLQHPTSRASQLALPSAGTKAPPHRDKAMETAGKAGGRRQPPQRLPTAIPSVVSRSRLQPAGKVAPSSKHTYLGCTSESTSQETVYNRTRELMENDKADQTWVCVGSPYLSALQPCPAPGCGDAACAAQYAVGRTCAGAGLLHGSLHPLTPCPCQLSQELEHVKKELERVKGELADKAAECEAYCQTISSLQAQLRAAGICPEDAAEDKTSIWERN